jgi:hypothetical protein
MRVQHRPVGHPAVDELGVRHGDIDAVRGGDDGVADVDLADRAGEMTALEIDEVADL